ncbi:MAG: hypothetical protein HYT61_02415 [Candidatus Yanofskybacteria bacterium]|nr:hypothetical protein [Candidatus Yanofskybacteria bacterium]
MEKIRRFTFGRIVLATIILFIFCFVEAFLFNGKEFYRTADAFSGAVSRGDQLAARENLQNLQNFYELNKKLHPLRLDGQINKRFFKDAQYFKSAYDYLTGNYERVIQELSNNDDYRSYYMRSNSKWRLAQGLYEQSLRMGGKTRQTMQEQAIKMSASTKDDYEQAVKKDPFSTLPPKWNYDLTTDPSAAARALEPKPIKIRIMLGEGGKKGKNPGDLEGEAPGKGTLDLDRKSGDKPNPNNKPGTRREG